MWRGWFIFVDVVIVVVRGVAFYFLVVFLGGGMI